MANLTGAELCVENVLRSCKQTIAVDKTEEGGFMRHDRLLITFIYIHRDYWGTCWLSIYIFYIYRAGQDVEG